METTFWTALATGLSAALVTSLGTDRRIRVHLNDPLRPIRVHCIQKLTVSLHDQLLEGRFVRIPQANDGVPAADRHSLGIDENQIAVVELGLHTLAADAQHESILAAVAIEPDIIAYKTTCWRAGSESSDIGEIQILRDKQTRRILRCLPDGLV